MPIGMDEDLSHLNPDETIRRKKHYFINEEVEWLLTCYKWTGCTDIKLRDEIMSHATELIRQIIRKQGLHQIYPGHDESAFNDLIQTAWCQIERTLYKYRARPHCRRCYSPDRPSDSVFFDPADLDYHIVTFTELLHTGYRCERRQQTFKISRCPHCNQLLSDSPIVKPQQGIFGGSETIIFRGTSKVFNMWSQVARTVILAYIKKEGRDKKNSGPYRDYVFAKTGPVRHGDDGFKMERFFAEATEIFKYNDSHLKILDALVSLSETDDKPYDGIISKLVEKSGQPRAQVLSFIKMIRLRSHEFTDSPISKNSFGIPRISKSMYFDNT